MLKKYLYDIYVFLKRNFIYGFVVILPIFSTIWVIRIILGAISSPLSILGGSVFWILLVTFVFVVLVGFFARQYFGRLTLQFVETYINKVPIVHFIYGTVKQVLSALSSSYQSRLKSCVLVEYPRKGVWTIGFVTNSDDEVFYTLGEGEVSEKIELISFVNERENMKGIYLIIKDIKYRVISDVRKDGSIAMVCMNIGDKSESISLNIDQSGAIILNDEVIESSLVSVLFPKKMRAVFVPTTPNPTSGFFLYINSDEAIPVNLSVNQAIKLIMSAGMIHPDEIEKK